MSNESGAAEQLPVAALSEITEEQVAVYLGENPDFFLSHQELLADLTLPHESGKAVSLLERQVTLLRERNYSAREQLGSLLENASKNDQLFEITRSLILSLLRVETASQLVSAIQEVLLTQENIDACELLLDPRYEANSSRHSDSREELSVLFADVFRLKHTHCGKPAPEQLDYLFGTAAKSIMSTALCPIMAEGRLLGILAIASRQNHYFNVNLDTLFLDFIGNVIAAILEGQFSR